MALIKNLKKHRASARYMESREREHYCILCTYRNQVRNITTKMQVNQENNIAIDAISNLKKCLNFVKSQTKTGDGVPNLEGEGNMMTTTDEEKAKGLINQFSSVFT